MDISSKQPQISEMFQKFAIAFKTKTIEFFAEEEEENATTTTTTTTTTNTDTFSLLDSAEEFIPDQKVVVIKPDTKSTNTQFSESLISSLFATLSSFEASYLQLQTAHVPIDEQTLKATDITLVSNLQRLSDVRKLYKDFKTNPNLDFPFGSCLEAQVQENQSKLRALETMFNRLQGDIDVKDNEVLGLKKKLEGIQESNFVLGKSLKFKSSSEVLLTIRVFDSMLREACRSLHCFTKLLIGLMRKADWDLDMAANSVYCDVEYAKKGHNQYAFLSFVSLGMFRRFDVENFGLYGSEEKVKDNSLKELLELVAGNPMEVLSKNPRCDFSRFCERKYEELIHPAMESSIFRNFDRREAVLDSWRSLSLFYEAFVKMSSSIWFLHKLAYSFNPAVEIFQVERGVDFSMVYMEDVTKRGRLPVKCRPKVGFTVIPGFKIGRTSIQSQVYLTGFKCAD